MDGKTIPIKTLPDLIRHYERRQQQIADHYNQRAVWGHAKWDSHELAMVNEFLHFLYGLDRDEEIKQMQQTMDLAWKRMYKYLRPAYYEACVHCPEQEEGDDE